MSLKINLYRNTNKQSKNYGEVYGRVKNATPIGVTELAKHMAEHNTPYSEGVIKGILTDAVKCMRELMLLGQPIKLDNLAIFSAQVSSTGAKTVEDYDLKKNITCVRMLAQSTGTVRKAELTKEGFLEYSDLAQAIRDGKAELPMGDEDGDGGSGSDEPDVRP